MAQTPKKNTSGRGQRDLTVKVKSARGRTMSSTMWLQRQLNDPYVVRAKADGYRGRAAYKIMELDDKFHFLTNGARVVDLGAAPGGWCQVAVPRINALGEKKGKEIGTILGVDLQEMEPIAGTVLHQLDFLADDADKQVMEWLGRAGGRCDVGYGGVKSVGINRPITCGLWRCARRLPISRLTCWPRAARLWPRFWRVVLRLI